VLRLVPPGLAAVAVGLLISGGVLLAMGAEAAAFFVGGVGGILAAGAAFYAVGRSEDRDRARGKS
jgi:hypothetical protein